MNPTDQWTYTSHKRARGPREPRWTKGAEDALTLAVTNHGFSARYRHTVRQAANQATREMAKNAVVIAATVRQMAKLHKPDYSK